MTIIEILIMFILLIIFVLGVMSVVAFVMYLNQRKEEQLSFTDPYEKVKNECLASCPSSIRNYIVSLTGDVRHGGMTLGRIIGYTRIKRTSTLSEKDKKEGKKPKKLPKDRLYLNMIYYSKPMHWIYQYPPFSVFRKLNNICFYDSQIANETKTLAGNVMLMGVSWRNVGLLNFINDQNFDEGEAVEVMRDISFVTLATDMVHDVSKLVKRGVDSNPAFKMAEAMKEDVVRFGGGEGRR